MESKNLIEKLQVLLPHWIEHNQNHEAEFRKWAASARSEDSQHLASLLDQAAAHMTATDEILKQAKTEAGGNAEIHPHSHHHDH
ncbi:MAG: hypothetical protein WCL16_03075 [bacterium]